jgi:hypothetical protein
MRGNRYFIFIYSLIYLFFLAKGLKTGMYYLRTRAAVNAVQFTVNKQQLKEAETKKVEEVMENHNDGMSANCPVKQKADIDNSKNIGTLNQQSPETPECCSA